MAVYKKHEKFKAFDGIVYKYFLKLQNNKLGYK